MPRNPPDFLRFVASNYQWLATICRGRTSFYSDDDIAISLRPFLDETSPSRKISDAKRLGVLSQATGEWSIPPFLARFIGELQDRFALASPAVIRSWIQKLEEHAHELTQLADNLAVAPSALDVDDAGFLLRETSDAFQTIAGSISDNCARIAIEVADYRATDEAAQLRSRLRRLIKLFEQYLEPILRIIDITGEFVAVTDRIAQTCARLSAHQERLNEELAGQIRDLRRDITWLRRVVVRQAGEANRELAPLCQTAIRESRIAKGVNRALEAIRQGRYGRLALEQLTIVEERDESLVADTAIEAYVRTMLNYEPTLPPRIGAQEPDELAAPWTATAVLDLIQDESFVPDILEWITRTCGPLRAEQAARLLIGLVDLASEQAQPTNESREYGFEEVVVTAVCWQWGTPDESEYRQPDSRLVAETT